MMECKREMKFCEGEERLFCLCWWGMVLNHCFPWVGQPAFLPLGSTFGFPFLVVFFLTFLEEEEKNIVKY